MLITGYIYSNFNYCPLVGMVNSAKSLNYVESLQKNRLVSCITITSFLTRPFTRTFYVMELNRKINLLIEIYKTRNIIKFEFYEGNF